MRTCCGNWVKQGKDYRLHGVSSDGQKVHMYAEANKKDNFTVWRFGLYVGGKNRTANDWYERAKYQTRITGKGSIKPLLFALQALLTFAEQLGRNEELHIEWEGDRRRRVYERLLNYPNWFLTAERDMYIYRNPKYWEFHGDDTGELRAV